MQLSTCSFSFKQTYFYFLVYCAEICVNSLLDRLKITVARNSGLTDKQIVCIHIVNLIFLVIKILQACV